MHFLKGSASFQGSCSSCVAVYSLSTFLLCPLTSPVQLLLFYTTILSIRSEKLFWLKNAENKKKGRHMVSKCRDVHCLEGEVVKLINITYPPCSTLIVLQVSMMFAPEGNEWKNHKSRILAVWAAGRASSPWRLLKRQSAESWLKGNIAVINFSQRVLSRMCWRTRLRMLNWVSIFGVFVVAVVHSCDLVLKMHWWKLVCRHVVMEWNLKMSPRKYYKHKSIWNK